MERPTKIPWLLSITLVVGAVALACEKGDGREKFGGESKAIENGDGEGGEGGTEGGGNDVGETGGSTNEPLAGTSKTLEQCTAESKAWVAVVDGGAQPSVCGDPLVTWCCNKAEILARFPTKKTEIEALFADFADTQDYKLYHCSSSAADKKHTFHMGKIEGGSTFYQIVFVTGLAPAEEGAGTTDCPTVTTADLTVQAADEDDDETEGVPLSFADDVSPILEASCAGAACHDADGTNPDEALRFIGDEDKFKAVSTTKIQSDEMPPPPATIDAADKAKLLDFLAQ